MHFATNSEIGSACILCGAADLEKFLDLGATALANSFVSQNELATPEANYPLRIGLCHSCGHVQLLDFVSANDMFANYLYISSASDTLKAHLWNLSDEIVKRYQLNADALVIDIGCNDGTLLDGFSRYGVKTVGVDPAINLAQLTARNGGERYTGFFNSGAARHIVSKWGKASVITATNTFPHIQDLSDFIKAILTVLGAGGVLVMEMHYLLDLIEQIAFDTIYHEHVSYWALAPMKYLFERNGMQIVKAERIPLHHGQLRVSVQREGEGKPDPSVQEILALEEKMEVNRFQTYVRFSEKTHQIKKDLQQTLFGLRDQRKRVVGYGAPAKGNTLLSFLQLGTETLDYIVDRSPLKQGLYTPGSHIPVIPPERLVADQPDFVLLLAWNFADEILRQQEEYRRRGGKFIIPLPDVRIV